MKLANLRILDVIQTLGTGQHVIVDRLEIRTESGQTITANKVTFDEAVLYAYDREAADTWHVVPKDDVVSVAVGFDATQCAVEGINPTLPDALAWAKGTKP